MTNAVKTLILFLTLVFLSHDVEAQHAPHSSETVLAAPGEAVFGAVQEVIHELETDPATDWSEVDLSALHRHLVDMHEVAVHVDVVEQEDIARGVRIVVQPTFERAREALARVLQAHPAMLERETGWTMEVQPEDTRYVLRVTTSQNADVAKVRALGYVGLLAYGAHHQRHHWEIATGRSPHRHHE